jgi:hypothetical protein
MVEQITRKFSYTPRSGDPWNLAIKVRPGRVDMPKMLDLSFHDAERAGHELIEAARASRVLMELNEVRLKRAASACTTCEQELEEGVHKVPDGEGGWRHAQGSPACARS